MKTLILSFILFATIGCSRTENENQVSTTPQTNTTPVLVGKAILFRRPSSLTLNQQNTVITNNSDWNTLLSKINSHDIVNGTISSTTIDFNLYQVIAVIQTKNSSTTVDITNVVENANDITITVQNLQVGVTLDIALPFHIIKIPRSTKPVIFI